MDLRATQNVERESSFSIAAAITEDWDGGTEFLDSLLELNMISEDSDLSAAMSVSDADILDGVEEQTEKSDDETSPAPSGLPAVVADELAKIMGESEPDLDEGSIAGEALGAKRRRTAQPVAASTIEKRRKFASTRKRVNGRFAKSEVEFIPVTQLLEAYRAVAARERAEKLGE